MDVRRRDADRAGALPFAAVGTRVAGQALGSAFTRFRAGVARVGRWARGAESLCFVEGTSITMSDGTTRPIEDICIGDMVLTRSATDPNAPQGAGRVTRIFHRTADRIAWVMLSNGMALGVTPEHAVWVRRRGWLAAGDLRVGDILLDTAEQPVLIIDIALLPQQVAVYNLEVAGTHTYYACDVWVHNTCTKAQVRDLARYWKLKGPQAHPRLGRLSHGQEWFTDGHKWYTFDVDGHRGGVWKVYDRRGTRIHTVDIDGNVVGR